MPKLLQKPLFPKLMLVAFLFCMVLVSHAQFLPEDEVRTLQIIFKTLKYQYWINVNQSSCNNGGQSFNRTLQPGKMLTNVTCDCSFSSNTVCHVTDIMLKGLSLSGVFPSEFGDLHHLRLIDLSRNYIGGTIPASLAKIPLTNLAVTANRITGTIPSEIGKIATLNILSFEDNLLEGNIPSSLGNLTNLTSMVLAGNNLTGPIPETFVNLKNLSELRLSGNSISGKIPEFVGRFTSLKTLDFQGTSLQGPIPSSFSLLTNLRTLIISDLNATQMRFPNLEGMANLQVLVLRNCSLTGEIPGYIINLSKLMSIDLSYNQLKGSVPESIQSSNKLGFLFLSNNSLSGSSQSWSPTGNIKFDFSYNNLTGPSKSSCQPQQVNLVASCPSCKSNADNWCLTKDLHCSGPAHFHSLFINCGGPQIRFEGHDYEQDTSSGGATTFFVTGQKWAFTSTGMSLYSPNANFMAQDLSNPNLTGVYQTARLAPVSLKYYGLCLRRGSYNVKLHFAEIVFCDDQKFCSAGRRIFDVKLQGNTVLKDFNIAADAGGVGKGVVKEFKNVYVRESTLEISLFWAGKGTTSIPQRDTYGPLISGITVTPNFRTGLSIAAITGIALASFVTLVSILVILKVYLGRKRRVNEEFKRLDTGYFTLRQIKTATNDFNLGNKLGQGGFGPVYKGVLPDGKVIAVKQLSSKSKQGNREFVNEIGMISALQHPNLVKLHGCCIEGKELLLVYEYMENNSLAHALFEDQQSCLDWETRNRICLGIARGLTYLHEESRLKIVHRDIKATNVLLDKNFNAKISDFGLARLDEEENTHISTKVAGTLGYMAPEYAMRGYLTDKADVYSYGIVVLEIVSGKSNTKYRPKEEYVHLLDWAYVLQEKGNLLDLVDPSLGSNYSEEEALRLLNLALLCTNPSPSLRPKMSSVVSMIDGRVPILPQVVKQSGTSEDRWLRTFKNSSQDSRTDVSTSSQSQPSYVRRSASF